MKKYLYFILPIFLLFTYAAQAQCPTCAINFNCYVPGGGLCPDSLPAGTVSQPYSQDVTFNIPPQIDAGPFSGGLLGIVPLRELKITGISGLPFGLNWQCNMPGNGCKYFPANNDTLGCVKICGTPFSNPGVYTLTIYVDATVDAGIAGNQTSSTTFTSQMVILPDTSSNLGFAMAPSAGCSPISVNFTNNFPSVNYVPIPGLTQGFLYAWDFGNGQQSNVENPPPINYTAPGNYPVTFNAIVDTFGFVLTNVSITNYNCTDAFDRADIYIKIFNGQGNEVFNNFSALEENATTPVNFSLSIPLVAPPYRIEVWDDDTFLGGADDNCYDNNADPHPLVQFSLPAVNAYGNSTLIWQNPAGTSLSFNYTITKNIYQITVTDTVRAFAVPPATGLSVTPSDEICLPDSIQLSVYPGYGYEWFYNDTVLLAGADSNVYWARQSGKYKVRIFNLVNGCEVMSRDTILQFNAPIPSFFNIFYSNSQGQFTTNVNGSGYTYQWQYSTGNGNFVDIPAPDGTANTYVPPANGDYRLIITNAGGCKDTSGVRTFATLDVDQNWESDLDLSLFPNPTTGLITIRFTKASSPEYVPIRVYSMLGQVVQAAQLYNDGTQVVYPLDLSGLAPGYYIVELGFTEKPIRTQIIKQ